MSIVVLTLALAIAAQPQRTKIAVLDIQDVSGDQAANARLLTQIVTGEVARDGSLTVLASNQIQQMLGFERQKQLLGCKEGSCLAEIAGALGVDDIITGQLGKIGTRYRLDLTIINQKKAQPIATRGGFIPLDGDALANEAISMANQLLVDAKLRDSAAAALALRENAGTGHSRTGAYVAFGAAAALLAGAGVMTIVTHGTYKDAVTDYKGGAANPSPSGAKLAWMAPLTDVLWAGAAGAAALGTWLYFSADSGGGAVGVGGPF